MAFLFERRVDMQKLPKNWFSWHDYIRLILKRWFEYSESDLSIKIAYPIRKSFEFVSDFICGLIGLPLLLIAIITATYDIVRVSFKKIMGMI